MAARKVMSYFDMNIQKSGDGFLLNKSVTEIQKDARKRIFKDMVFGNIDYAKYGSYFMNARFLEQLIIVSEEEMEKHGLLHQGARLLDIMYPGTPKVPQLMIVESKLFTTFYHINYYLKCVRDFGYDISFLPELTMKIYEFRNEFGNNY